MVHRPQVFQWVSVLQWTPMDLPVYSPTGRDNEHQSSENRCQWRRCVSVALRNTYCRCSTGFHRNLASLNRECIGKYFELTNYCLYTKYWKSLTQWSSWYLIFSSIILVLIDKYHGIWLLTGGTYTIREQKCHNTKYTCTNVEKNDK